MKKVNSRSLLAVFLFFMVFNVLAESSNAPVAAVGGSYVIGPGDVLNISVWKEEGLQIEALVRPDGGITFPLVGELQAGGMTADALSGLLVKKLKRYIPNPNVTVSVMKSMSNKIYVIGKVNRPGEFVTTGYMDVLQALTMAGGLTPYADSGDIKIIRRTENGTEVKLFDYDDIIDGESLEMNIILQAGDTVVVP